MENHHLNFVTRCSTSNFFEIDQNPSKSSSLTPDLLPMEEEKQQEQQYQEELIEGSESLTDLDISANVNEVTNQNGVPVTPTVPTDAYESMTTPVLPQYTPNGSEEWIRKIEKKITPTVGKKFYTVEEAVDFCKTYALACGFEYRLGTQRMFKDNTIRRKDLLCHRQGFNESKRNCLSVSSETQQSSEIAAPKNRKKQKKEIQRNTKITRVGCKAMIRISFLDKMYVIERFKEAHNHKLCSAKHQLFSKQSANLSLYHKQMILNNSKVNIGPTKTFRICKEFANGYENVGASLLHFKNFQRDVKCFIGEKDAEMFVNNLHKLSETRKGFYFAYDVDAGQNLCRVFWADAVARRNYSVFGDAVTFDPTYGTNKYMMVFTPFTGIDNHKKSVTFAGALLSNEDEPSFTWAFTKFLDAMGNKEPKILLTDQDPAIKNAVPAVFKTARHRFCMWHIMEKVVDKVGSAICKDTEFLTKFGGVVWNNDLEPSDFESQWTEIMKEFDLEEHRWLSYMFHIRRNWIPAYHRDLEMGCILRTTQRSESANSFFKKFENQFGTLVEFWMRYQSAMDQQRYTQKLLDIENDSSLPRTITPLKIELHASKVYTHRVFSEFQEEIKYSMCSCCVVGYTKTSVCETTVVEDTLREKTYEVQYSGVNVEVKCSCKLFERKGLLCRHVIWVLSGKRVEQIPERYIMLRWSKDALKRGAYDVEGNLVDDCDVIDVTKVEISKVWSEFYGIIGVLSSKNECQIREFAEMLKQFRIKMDPQRKTLSKEKELEMLLGCKDPEQVNILPPNHSKNKGSGKRLISNKKQSIAKAKKPKRLCNNCKQMANHDKRNCPFPFVEKMPENQNATEEEEAADGEEEDENDE